MSPSFPSSAGGTGLLDSDPVEMRPPESHLNPSNIFDVEGLVAVVTGGGTGTSVDPTFISIGHIRLTVYML